MTTKATILSFNSNQCNSKSLINAELVDKVSQFDLGVKASLSKKPFRILKLQTETKVEAINTHQALLSNDDGCIKVTWSDSAFLPAVAVGQIVSPRCSYNVSNQAEVIEISRPRIHQRPESNVNLFHLVQHDWVKDKSLKLRAANLFDELSEPHKLLFNAIFWDSHRFENFCYLPASMQGHHSHLNGTLLHTVEVVENIKKLSVDRDYINLSLAMLAGFLHDAGKAFEYQLNAKGGWDMTDRGKLLGHKITVLEWIIQAVAQWRIQLPEDHYLCLLHLLTAVAHAPGWMDLREPCTPESLVLSMADRLSGHDDLMARTLNEAGGFGSFHKHLKAIPFRPRG